MEKTEADFVSASELAQKQYDRPKIWRTGPKPRGDCIAFSMRKGYDKKGRDRLAVIISHSLVEKVGYLKGDRIDLLFDAASRKGIIKRVGDGSGYTLSRFGKNVSTKNKEITMTWYPGIPRTKERVMMDDVSIIDGNIHFTFPKEVLLEMACPYNHVYGKDTDEFDECDRCKVWEGCIENNNKE